MSENPSSQPPTPDDAPTVADPTLVVPAEASATPAVPPPPPPPAASAETDVLPESVPSTPVPPAAAYPPPPAGAYPPPAQGYAAPPVAYAPQAAPMTPEQERNVGMLSHGIAAATTFFSAGTLGFVAALVMYIIFKDRGPFARAHTANSLNVQIMAGLVMLISIPLMFVLVGFVSYFIAWAAACVIHVVGAIKASNGEFWQPPMTPAFVR